MAVSKEQVGARGLKQRDIVVLGSIVVIAAGLPHLVLNLIPAEYVQMRGAIFVLATLLPPVVAFFGLYLVADMRDAIAGSFAVAYLLLLVGGALLSTGEFKAVAGSVREVLLQNFTGLMGVVVAFYFGGDAAVKVVGSMASRPSSPTAGAATEGHDAESAKV